MEDIPHFSRLCQFFELNDFFRPINGAVTVVVAARIKKDEYSFVLLAGPPLYSVLIPIQVIMAANG